MSQEISFEKAMEKLEKIVGELESGEITLDEALKKYEEGVKLSRICQGRLSEAEKKIEILTRTLDGTLKKEPFDEGKISDDKPSPSAKKTAKREKTDTDEEDDFLL